MQAQVHSAQPALQVSELSKSFGAARALNALDLTIGAGEIHALAGSNGSGKSTFIKILSGYHKPDSGSALISGQALDFGSAGTAYLAGCRFVHQDLGLVDALSVEDNICLNRGYPTRFGTIRTRDNRESVSRALSRVGLEVDPRSRLGELTPAMKTAVAIARALHSDEHAPVRLMVLDEPTATLPANDVDHLLGIVRRVADSGVGVLYVTHRLDEIFQLADRVTVLRDGHRVSTNDVLDLSRTKLVHLMVGSELDETAELAEASDGSADEVVLSARGLTASHLLGVDLTAHRGEVLGIAGITGSGSETILGALFGALPRAGEVVVHGKPLVALDPRHAIECGMAYVPPDRKTMAGLMDASARENMTIVDVRRFWRRLGLNRAAERAEVAQLFKSLDVRPADNIELPLKSFSGGNQQKILLAKWLRCAPSVLLLDEPSQGVDVAAKAIIHRQLRAAAADGAAVVVSSSDTEELAALCDRVVILRNGRVATVLDRESLSSKQIAQQCVGSDIFEAPPQSSAVPTD